MKLGIMQPYLFPYIGYFQLIHAVDQFVVYDDVQYIKRGWINRNRILVNGQPHTFQFSLKKDAQEQKINKRLFANTHKEEVEKFFKTLQRAYKKAAYFDETMELVEKVFIPHKENMSDCIRLSIDLVCEYLNIETNILNASDILNNEVELKGEERIIHISTSLGACEYLNTIGGIGLYSKEAFLEKEINLFFLKPQEIKYNQFENSFVPNLSILDIMMFNSKEEIKELLNTYELI